jgi:hypothetical protein
VIHDILLDKSVAYGVRGEIIRWFKSYIEQRKQRVEIHHSEKGEVYSDWEIVKYGVPQGFVLGPLLFLIYIDVLPLGMNSDYKTTLYEDDTSVLISSHNTHELQVKSNMALNTLKYWFTNNGLSLNLTKTKMLKFQTSSRNNTLFQLHYKNQHLQDVKNIKFLGIEINNFMNCKAHVKLILPKLGNACFAIRNMKSCSNTETLRMIYLAYFHSVMKNGIIFWGNSTEAKKVFLAQKRTSRIMMGINHRDSCRPVFKELNILTLASQYILSLMIFVKNNVELFTFNCTVHNKLTRNRGNLHVLQSHLSIRQKGIHYMSVKIFTSLPKFLVDLLEDRTMFVERLKEISIHNAFYSVDEFLNYCQKKY